MMAGYLFARAGVRTRVLEKHDGLRGDRSAVRKWPRRWSDAR
ncbi:hypothetical protein [Sphingomonas sp.]